MVMAPSVRKQHSRLEAIPRLLRLGFRWDGHEDLAATNFESDSVSVLLGHGDGTFGAAGQLWDGCWPWVHRCRGSQWRWSAGLGTCKLGSSDVSVLLGRGDGTFGTQVRFLAGRYTSSLAIGNFNGNRRPDVVVVNTGSQDVWILLNQGQFPVGLAYSHAERPRAMQFRSPSGRQGAAPVIAERKHPAHPAAVESLSLLEVKEQREGPVKPGLAEEER